MPKKSQKAAKHRLPEISQPPQKKKVYLDDTEEKDVEWINHFSMTYMGIGNEGKRKPVTDEDVKPPRHELAQQLLYKATNEDEIARARAVLRPPLMLDHF